MEFDGVFESIIQRTLTKKEVVDTLYSYLPTVEEYVTKRSIFCNKYTDLALKYGYKNYRICTLADLHTLKLMRSFTDNQREFFNYNGEWLTVFNEVGGKPVSIIFRSLREKQFIDYSIFFCPYGLDMLDENFKYGKWLMITEGMYDADSFRVINKNIVALLTSHLTLMQAEVLNTLTDQFIFAFDNDEAGSIGMNISKKKLLTLNPKCRIEMIKIFSGDKDLGVMEEMVKNEEEYKRRRDYYEVEMGFLIDRDGLTL